MGGEKSRQIVDFMMEIDAGGARTENKLRISEKTDQGEGAGKGRACNGAVMFFLHARARAVADARFRAHLEWVINFYSRGRRSGAERLFSRLQSG